MAIRKKERTKAYLQRKPYKDWSRSDIYYGIVDYRYDHGLPSLNKAYIIPTFTGKLMRREFLKLVGCENGRDIYTFDTDKIEALTDESLEVMLTKYQENSPKHKKKRPPRYKMEYIAVWEDHYKIVEEDVDIFYRGAQQWFESSIDGSWHRVKERGAKILEVLYNE